MEFSELSNRVIGCAIEQDQVQHPASVTGQLQRAAAEAGLEELRSLTLHALHVLSVTGYWQWIGVIDAVTASNYSGGIVRALGIPLDCMGGMTGTRKTPT